MSRTLRNLDWENSTPLDGEATAAVSDLKQRPGNHVAVLGRGVLVRTLIENDLVDEYRLLAHPIVLGSGKRLFADADPLRRLRQVDSQATTTGVMLLTYRPA